MAESNASDDLLTAMISRTIELQRGTIQSKYIMIIVHDNEQLIRSFKQIAAMNSSSRRLLHVFDNVDECYEFVVNEVSIKPHVEMRIFVGGGLVRKLVDTIHFCEQVKKIIIIDKPPFNKEEQELMKKFPQVNKMSEQ